MFLLYLDSSGTPEPQDQTCHYVLVGAAVHEHTWFAMDKRIRGLKKRYAYPGEDFELHVLGFNCSIHEQDRIDGFDQMNYIDRRLNVRKMREEKLKAEDDGTKRRTLKQKYRRTDPFIHLTRNERSRLYEESLELIGGHNGLVMFGEAIEKQHQSVACGTVDCIRQAFEQVITRFDAFLLRRARWRELSTSRPQKSDKGMIVMDSDRENEKDIEKQFSNYRKQGHPWGKLNYVIDAPFFVSSDKFSGVQIVDVCAYALRRYLDKGAKVDSPEEQQFLKIFNCFDRDPNHLHGLRHYTPAGTCGCVICKERGH